MRRGVMALICAPILVSTATLQGASSGYVLPYPSNHSYRLIQGNEGRWGHTGHSAYSFDFAMPIGSEVSAARAGEVIAVEERYADGTRTSGQENYVFVRHSDGSFARYYHLTTSGSLVSVGDHVTQGQIIGLSGNTGASAGPHLHFDVTTGCPEYGCQTIPVVFTNARENPLRENEVY